MGVFGELSRRNVIRVAIAYAIVAWLVVQVADIVLDAIGAPAWVMQTIILLLALGFVVAVIFAWAYEVTPAGVKRESEVDRSQSITHMTGRKLDRVITGLLVLSLAYFIWESRFAEQAPPAEEQDTVAAAAEEVTEEITTPADDLSIAVLPFDNRSALAEDAFFAEGMHDDLLTTLAKIGSMKVISRTSVMEYQETTKKIPQIAAELGVANILEGGVQRAGSQVRINVQLIDAETDEHLWAEIYDRELTAENLFAIQSEISQAIADALHATLSPEEIERINMAPTDNLEAFDHYLRGRNLMASRAVDELELATAEFLEAVSLDPRFALAWIGVADSHSLLEAYSDIEHGAYFEIRDDAINRALEIDPRLGEAHTSLGSLLNDKGDEEAAEDAFKLAIRLSPNYATSYHWLSFMLRDDLNRTAEALTYAQRAAELDPNSAVILTNLWGTYDILGDIRSMSRLTEQALEMHPDFSQAHTSWADLLFLRGDYAGSVEADRKRVELDAGSAASLYSFARRHASIGAFDEANQIMQTLGERFPEHPLGQLGESFVLRAAGDAPNVRPIIAPLLESNPGSLVAVESGFAALLARDYDLALEAFNLVLLDDLVTMEYTPAFIGSWAGMTCSFAKVLLETPGSEARGRELLAKTIAFQQDDLPNLVQYPERYNADTCFALNGDVDKALDVMQLQLDHHFVETWRWKRQNPVFDHIREHPRFVALQSEFDARTAEQVTRLRQKSRPAFEF
ncbi:MAG TPA: tetratricopeptide repeat protein [Woeseiaceae bacterium]|jgi:TolB-like protein/Tfp pilus assembly protein PilF|nr:tetratricopeptide repeat protein [Woeseiaceae bacterium]